MKFLSIVRDREHSRHLNPDCKKSIRYRRGIGIDNFPGGKSIPGAQNYRPLDHRVSRLHIRKHLFDIKKMKQYKA